MAEKTKKKKSLPMICLGVITAFAAAAVLIFAVHSSLKNDRTVIEKNGFTAEDSAEEEDEPIPVEEIDLDRLIADFAYIDIDSSQLGQGTLALTDASHTYGGAQKLRGIYESLFNYDGLQIASAKSADASGDKEMLAALREMLTAFYSYSGLRTVMIDKAYAEAEPAEEGYYDIYGRYVAPVNTAACYEHESGFAVDLGLYIRETGELRSFDGSGDYEWFAKHAYRYGFVLRYPADKSDITGTAYNPSHFRYVGREAAAVMREQGLCFEEFQEYIKGFDFYNPLTVQTTEGCRVMYYVPDSGFSVTNAMIPVGSDGEPCPYTVSGNNSDGYIVTVVPTAEFAVTETDSETDGDSSSLESNF